MLPIYRWVSPPSLVITIASSEENAPVTRKKTFGFHPSLAFLDRPEIAGGEALAGLLVTPGRTPPPTTSPC